MKCVNLMLIITTLFSGSAKAGVETFGDLAVKVYGEGQPAIMLPGLNSAGALWDETCAKLQPLQCHIIQLPGFAGLKAVETGHFLEDMRDQILAYIDHEDLKKPVLVGHSLGGILSLMVAIERPRLPDKLVLVDSLPFLPAAQNSKATPDSVRSMANSMRKQIVQQTAGQYRTRTKAMVAGMTRSDDKKEVLETWILNSDRNTTADAMYALMTADLRSDIRVIEAPTLVLGSWAAYRQHGATQESTAKVFEEQFKALQGVQILLSEDGYHFLMWDDPEWLVNSVLAFLK